MIQAVRLWEVLLIVLLASAGVVPARPAHVGEARLAVLTASSEGRALPAPPYAQSRIFSWSLGDGDHSDHDYDKKREKDRDKDDDRDKNHHGPKPTPEPSTILSFSTALLIGSGVLYSRRLRKNK
jgi:hypothetical protein